MLLSIPLLVIVVAAYNILALTGLGALTTTLLSVPLLSGVTWTLSLQEALVALGLVLLYLEIFKATRATAQSIVDHLLSMMLFIIALIEFLALRPFGTTTFFLIMLMCLVDVIAGFTVGIQTARRDFGYDEGLRR
jgi:hypothetical protein